MYLLATGAHHPELRARIVRHLRARGLPAVTVLDGVDMELARAHKRERQVGTGDGWVLWHEPPFGASLDPPEELVLAWVREVAETPGTPQAASSA